MSCKVLCDAFSSVDLEMVNKEKFRPAAEFIPEKRSTSIDPVTGSNRPRPGIWNHAEAAMYGMRELSPGTSVFLYEEDYHVALSKIKVSEKTLRRDGTPAARFLLSVFYTSAELVNATIRNDGDDASKGPGYVPLNKNIIYAIEVFCSWFSDSTVSHIRSVLSSKITAYRTHAKNKMRRIANVHKSAE